MMASASPSTPRIGLASRASDHLFSSPASILGSSGSRTGSPLRSTQRDWSAERSTTTRSLIAPPSPPMPIAVATHPLSSGDRGYGVGSSCTSFEPTGSFLPGPASSVIAAFRQLQTKARQIEQERSDAIRDRDELRRQLDNNMRTQSFWRSQSDLQAHDSFQTLRAATEQVYATKRDLELQVKEASDINMALSRSNGSDRASLVTTENEVVQTKENLHVVQAQNRVLEHELMATQGRCERVADTVEASPDARLKQVLAHLLVGCGPLALCFRLTAVPNHIVVLLIFLIGFCARKCSATCRLLQPNVCCLFFAYLS